MPGARFDGTVAEVMVALPPPTTTTTMPQNLISATLAPADLTTILANLEANDALMPFLLSLSNEQRKNLFKAGAKRAGAIALAQVAVTQFPEIFPGTFNATELNKDVALRSAIMTVQAEYISRAAACDDTLLALNADGMQHVREVYKYVKAAKDTVPGIRPIYEQMNVYFDRPDRPNADAGGGNPPA
jgi:hypothetical protein